MNNQNVGKSFAANTRWYFSGMKNRLQQMAANKAQAKQAAYDNSMEHLSAWAEELDRQAYQVNDEVVTKAYQKEAQKAKVAAMVKYAATRAWEDWSQYKTVQDILWKYLRDVQWTPWVWQAIKDFVNSDEDAEAFWMAMWWIETPEEDSLNAVEQFFSNVWDTVSYPAEVFWQSLSDFLWWADRKLGDEELADLRALNEFSYHKYGKYIQDMDEDEILRLELDLQLQNITNGSILSETNASVAWDSTSAYQDEVDRQRWDTWLAWTTAWWLLWAAEIAYSIPTMWFSLVWNLPWWREALEWLTERWYDIWNLTTLIPEFWDYIEDMPEDVQENYKMIWGNTLLALILHNAWKYATTKKNPNWKWRVYRDWIKNVVDKIDSSEFIKSVQEQYKRYNPNVSMPWLRENIWKPLVDAYNNEYWFVWWSKFGAENMINDAKKWISEWLAEKWFKSELKDLNKEVQKEAQWPTLKELQEEEKNESRKKDIAWKVSWSTSKNTAVEETEISKRALESLIDADVDLSKIKTEEELLDAFWWNSDKIAVFEDWIYSMDKRRWKKTDTKSVVTNTDEFWFSDSYVSDTIGKWFEVLHEIYKNDPQIQSQLRILEKRREQKWLNRQEVNTMSKMIAEWAKLYKNTTTDMLSAERVKYFEDTRRALKDWARSVYKDTVPDLYDALWVLDWIWSDSMNMEAMINRNIWELQAYRNGGPLQESWQEAWSTLKRTLDSRWKNIINAVLKDQRYNPLKRSADLNSNLTKFQESDSGVKRTNNQKKVKDWYEETFREIVDPNGNPVWEWEVIYPKKRSYKDPYNYLEDIVEIVETTEMSPVDYAKFENQLKKLWLSEEQVESAKRATQIVQESLFWDESKTVADIEEWVMKGKNKSKK